MSEFRELPAGKIIGVKTSFFTIMNPEKYDPRAIPTAWKEFFSKYQGSGLPGTNTFYGAALPNNSMDAPMDYVAGVLVGADISTPAGFEGIDFPAGAYFTFTHRGPVTGLGTSYPQAYGMEFPKAGREMRNAPHLEIYESDKDPMDPNYEMIIAIPVL